MAKVALCQATVCQSTLMSVHLGDWGLDDLLAIKR